MNLVTKAAVTAAFASVASFASAATTTLNFNGETIGAIAGDTFMTSQDGLDFTFTGPGLRFRTLPTAFETAYSLDTWLSTTSDAGPITMLIEGAVINSVTFLNPINGSVTAETDIIDAEAFDSSSTLLDSVSSSDEYITLTGPDIASIVFVENSPGQGFVLGEFIIDYDMNAVPLPAGGFLLIGGLGALAAMRRRKS